MVSMSAMDQASVLTGHAPNPGTGVVQRSALVLSDEELPIRLIYNGKRYVITSTRGGGLIMNGEPRV